MATTGAHQSAYGGGSYDAFLVKFNTSGVRQWGTYYGGSGYEEGYSCSTDASGNVYLAGRTGSNTGTVIATTGAHQSAYGGATDAFLVKFNASGVRQWSTYYGGSGYEEGRSCSTDGSGNVYLAGRADSNTGTVIATTGAHQSVHGGNYDAFLVKFNASGIRQWGTYYGGSGYDFGRSCSTDGSGNVYLAGYTDTNTGTSIGTTGAHQSAFGLGLYDAFLVKFNSNGVRQWGTYYGGYGDDYGYSCSTDASGNVYLAGGTGSNTGTVIATTGAHQSAYGGANDAFLVNFNPSGVRQWGTYYGGSGDDQGLSCSTDASGNVYLAGYTNSNTGTVIATTGAHQSAIGGGYDAFIVNFNTSGVRQWGSYYGGSGDDSGLSCSTDASGNIYLEGATYSNTGTGIATAVAHQSAIGGGYDAFLVKFFDCVNLSPVAAVNGTVCSGASINFTASITGTATPTYSWAGPNSYIANVQNPSIAGAVTLNIGVYTLTVNNAGCVETTTTQVSAVNALPTVSVASSNTSFICVGSSATLTATGASTYVWNTTATTAVIVVSPNTTTSYTVTGTGANGCTANAVISQSVSTCTGLNSNFSNLTSNFIVYPNPTNSVINIEFLVFNNESYTIEIVNIVGQVLHKETVTTKNLTLKTDNLQNGVYFVKATVDGKTKTVKLVKE
jgi:hypothetical protein